MVRLSGASPLYVPTELETHWKPIASDLAERATERTRGVILNSPNNPTGAVVEREQLESIVEWCEARDSCMIFDETYDRFLYDGRPHVTAASLREEHPDRIVLTGAASKTWAMTGWRLGWAIASRELIDAMASYQSHSTSNASSISQRAALGALSDPAQTDEAVARMLAEYGRRRETMVSGLAAIPVPAAGGCVLRLRRRLGPLRREAGGGLGGVLRTAPLGDGRRRRARRRVRRRRLRPVLVRGAARLDRGRGRANRRLGRRAGPVRLISRCRRLSSPAARVSSAGTSRTLSLPKAGASALSPAADPCGGPGWTSFPSTWSPATSRRPR